MNKVLKIALGIFAAAGLLIVALLVFVYSSLDSIVKTAIEDVASDVTQTEVTLDNVSISPTDGLGSIGGFRMTNPDGFESDTAFRFSDITVQLDIQSLATDVIRIKEVRITSPDVTYELSQSLSNIETIGKNAESYGTGADSSSGESGSASSSEEAGPKVVIENFYLTDGTIRLAAPFLGDNTANIPLPDIHLKNIGENEGGATPAEAAKAALNSITGSITSVASSVNVTELLGGAGEVLNNAAGAAQGAVEGVGENVGEAAGAVGEGLGDAAEDAGEAINNLFGN